MSFPVQLSRISVRSDDAFRLNGCGADDDDNDDADEDALRRHYGLPTSNGLLRNLYKKNQQKCQFTFILTKKKK